MPRSALQLEQIREASREKILDSALRLFAQHGYATTSVRMIARDAGIAQGLLYNYYDGKEALLYAIFERSMTDVQKSFEIAATGRTPRERIERLVSAAFALVGQNLSFWRLSYQLRMQPGVSHRLEQSVRAGAETIRVQLESLLGEAGVRPAQVEARVLFAAIDGVAQHYALDPEHYPIDEVAAALVQRFLPRKRGAVRRPEGKKR